MPWWAVMPLPYSIPSSGELSGAQIAGAIDGFGCSVLFPRTPDKGWELLPPGEGPWDQTGVYWGGKISSVHGPAENIKGLGISLPESNELDESELWNLQIASVSWQAHLLDWLAVLHGQPPGSITLEPAMLFLVDDPDYTPLNHYEPAEFVTMHTWQRAIEHASRSDTAPLKLVLLHRATQAFYEGDYRVAVVDVATAVELAITQAIRRRLAPAGAEAADAVLMQVPMLGRRVALARKSGIPMPPSIQDLVELRNQVVHRGTQPKQREVARALDTATKLVNDLLTEEEINAE